MNYQIVTRVLAASLAAVTLTTFAADDLPKAQTFARYEPMMNRSPFAVATAAVALPAATPNFAKDLYIANCAKTAEGDLVTVASSTDKNFKKYLSTQTTVDGYSVPNIEWSERVGATKVTISKDGQFATLTFNQALLSQAATNNAAMPPQSLAAQAPPQIQQQQTQLVPPPAPVGMGNVPGQPVNTVKPAPIPMLPTPPPRVRGVIQRNPNANQPAQQPVQQPEAEQE